MILLQDMLTEFFGILKFQIALDTLEYTVIVDLLPVRYQSPLPAELHTTLWAFNEGADLQKRMDPVKT